LTVINKADHEYYMHYVFNQLLKKDVGGILKWEDDECSIKDFREYFSKGYSVCKNYSYYGYKYSKNNIKTTNNSNTIFIASDNNENKEIEYDVGKDFGQDIIEDEDDGELCYNFNNYNNANNSTISDNNLNTSGIENTKYFNFLSIFIMLTSIVILQMHNIF